MFTGLEGGYREFDEYGQMLEFLVQSGDLATWRAITEQCTEHEVRRSLAAQFLRVPWRMMRVSRPTWSSITVGGRWHCTRPVAPTSRLAFSLPTGRESTRSMRRAP